MKSQLASFFMGDYLVMKTNLKTSRLDFEVLTIDKSYVCGVKRTRRGYWYVHYEGQSYDYMNLDSDKYWYRWAHIIYDLCGPKISKEKANEILGEISFIVE